MLHSHPQESSLIPGWPQPRRSFQELRTRRNQSAPDNLSEVSAESGFSRSSFPAPWSLFRFSGAVFFCADSRLLKNYFSPKNLAVTVDIFPLILQGLNGNNSPFVLHPCLDADLSGDGAELSWPQLGLFSRPGKGNQSHLSILPSTPLHPCPRTGLGVGNQELFTPKSTSNISSVAGDPSPVRGGTCLDPGIHSGRFGSPRAWQRWEEIEFLCVLRDFVAIPG